MTIDELNALTLDRLDDLLRPCADVDSWVETLTNGRPYVDATAMLDRAVDAAAGWTGAEVARALADHPRIGERPAGEGPAADHSRAEQAGIDEDADRSGLAVRLADGNRRYEARFGRVYLVRAAGRTGAEMLALLETRLGNDDAVEADETKRQLAEIAVLRLRGLLQDDHPGGEDAG